MQPRRLDGKALSVNSFPDGRVFVDSKPERGAQDKYGCTEAINRGGPEYSEHYCQFEDYGLADGLVRCRKCGLVKHG